tara:strand:+ start:452 stop:1183 length:732 start_codon:yes stop_codon:yes gene_type:complete
MNKKTVLILGATCEVGKELCKIYADNNYNLILISRNVKKNIDLKEMLLFKFPEIEIDTYELDILNLEDQTKIYENLKATPDGIISLIGETHFFETIKEKKFIQIINTNFTYLVNFLSLFLNDFEKRNKGFLICISSVAGIRGRAKNFIYGSSKAALTTYLSGCRNYYNKSNLFIMTVLPGFIKNNGSNQKLNNFLAITPLKLANKIYFAHKKRKQVIYSSFLWKIIMFFISILPNKIFNKMFF